MTRRLFLKNSIPILGIFTLMSNKNKTMAKTVLHKSASRGSANHGWLVSRHTFSFANYYNEERMNFGALRVLNDDQVAAGEGFGTHPHRDMEIISIPLEGDLEHKDSMGNVSVIKKGDVQIMSAGRGIRHSEYNKNKEQQVKFLQIWVIPSQNNLTPSYDQFNFDTIDKTDKIVEIITPTGNGNSLKIHQNAYFSLSNPKKGTSLKYKLNGNGQGVYVFLLSGNIEIEGQNLETRDGFGIWDTSEFTFTAKENSEILFMEVPMNV